MWLSTKDRIRFMYILSATAEIGISNSIQSGMWWFMIPLGLCGLYQANLVINEYPIIMEEKRYGTRA
ncbi:hypothetical protein D307_gp028 [Bacillus phage Bastille]|uniref:Uncharacterized protein n=1 Tax=Bacillus phage Bastille TaxID=57477 RepID=J9PMG0_9CAUD|nr:hypothetical protein D307_gp028 [Bacillus phage Bastille]AEQ34436.1 hypothetical protein [Bacillus phage Bastille]AZF89136.1 membrane-bound protein [Bacillus phage vB_BthM-Goe5]